MKHLTDEQLNDWADELLPDDGMEAVQQHLGDCLECHRRANRIKGLLAQARQEAVAVEPDADLWSGIRERIERDKVVPLNPRQDAEPRPIKWRYLAAAAVALMVLSSTVTAVLLRPGTEPVDIPGAALNPIDVEAPGEVATLVGSYESAAARLQRAFEARRPELPAATVQRIETNLRAIDRAIEETLEMLRTDEDNAVLLRLLDSTYQQKFAVLELAAEAAL